MKAALTNQCAGLSKTLAAQGIRIDAVSPGPVFSEGGPGTASAPRGPSTTRASWNRSPRPNGHPQEETARDVVFVASPAAALLTGANIMADGGLTRRIPI